MAGTQTLTQVCLPTGTGATGPFGAAYWNNPTGAPLTIDSVTLVDADGVDLVGDFVIPNPGDGHGGSAGIGAVSPYPPEQYEGNTLLWDQQHPVPGAQLLPGVQTDLIVGVRHTRSDPGTAEALRVTYHSPSDSFTFDIPKRFLLVERQDGCTLDDES